ncbi:MAG: amino acid dehydrogenase [Pseudomonadales bacterium]|nr:amino acid dehydrogenase [Pseudomonadales bacterium]
MFDKIEQAHLSELHFKSDESSQLKSIIAIHNTKLGPALGGCRCIEYDCEESAVNDVIRLAKGMSYKAALAGVPQGGGKAVIMKPRKIEDRVALYQSFGRFVDELGGRYITAVDSGTNLNDMDQVSKVTHHVSGSHQDGLDPSPITALGVFAGIKSAVKHKLGYEDLNGVHVAIQGIGNVGGSLADLLYQAGARLTLTDIDTEKLDACSKKLNAAQVQPEDIYNVSCDVFAPCGLGAVINDETINQLQCAIVAGSANNQLASNEHGNILHRKDILYAPDYVINAGGLINVSLGIIGVEEAIIRNKTLGIHQTLNEIFQRSKVDNTPPHVIADLMAEEVLYH